MENCRPAATENNRCQTSSQPGAKQQQQQQQRHDDGLCAFLPPGFDSFEEYLTSLRSFLASCEPLTDLMIVDYFTTKSWENRIPKDWRDAFESEQGRLSSLDLMKLVSNVHLRDFNTTPSSNSRGASTHGPTDWPESLKDFVRMVRKLSINRTLDPTFTKFKDTLDIHLIPGMSPKKLHEVEILSGLIASYAKERSIGSVIDLGAGQGYLSRVLAFQHQLCVLGVDSDTIQTCGAQTTQKRTEKLFVNKTKLKRSSAAAGRAGSGSASELSSSDTKTSTSCETSAPEASPSLTAGETSGVGRSDDAPDNSTATAAIPGERISATPCKKAKRRSRSGVRLPVESTAAGGSSSNSSSNRARGKSRSDDVQAVSPGATAETDIARTSSSTSTLAAVVPLENNDSEKPQGGNPGAVDSAIDPTLATTPGSNFQLQHITHHITAATLPTLLKEHFPRKSKSAVANTEDGVEEEEDDERWTLCGLHACGDLTSNMTKLYLESSATCLFSVGCCYHWITERFNKDGSVAITDGTHGFPLSATFNRHKAHLGDHGKMIACQSPERWLKYQKETEDAIHGHYFRALLHKLMVERDLYPGPPAVAPVLGRMGKHRLKGFPHYLTTAIQRLKLSTDVIRPEEAQAAYEEFLEQDLYRIGILWALRTMLGPLFEGMILLDRATYLHENIVGDGSNSKEKKGSVHLVAGFDVVESPRNMILIALKD